MLFDPAHIQGSSVGLEALLNALPSMTWCADARGLTTFVNQDLLAFTGRSADAFLHQRFAVAVHPEDRDSLQRCWEQAWMDVTTFRCEFRLERHDGTFRWIRSEARPLHAPSGELLGWIGSCTLIDDLKVAQEQATHLLQRVQRREERFQALAQATHQVVWSVVPPGAPPADDPAWPGLVGQHPALRPEAWTDLVHPDDLGATLQAVEQANDRRTPYVVEHRMRQPDGGYRLMQARAFPVLDEAGGVREWIGVHTDITETKEAEQVLRDSEQRYRALFEAMPNIVWTSSRDGQVRRFNEHWRRFTGLPTEPDGLSWLEAIHPEDRPRAVQARTEGLRTGHAYEVEFRLRRHDGAYRWHSCHIAPFSSGVASDSDGWLGYAVHIHDRKMAEESVQRSEARFRSLVTASTQVVWTTTPDGLAVSSQPSWEALTGQPCERSRGSGWTAALHPDDHDAVVQAWAEAVRTRTTYQIKHRLRGADGTYRWYVARAVPVWEAGGLVREWVGVHTDIHEHELAELSRLRLERLVNESHDLIGVTDLSGQFQYINPAGLALLGRSEATGYTWQDIAAPTEHDRFQAEIVPALRATGHWLGDLDLQQAPSGERLPVNANLMLISDPHTRQALNFAVTARDIRERQLAEAAQQDLNAVLVQHVADRSREVDRLARLNHQLLDSAGEGIFGLDREGRTIFANRAALTMTGFALEDLTGQAQHGLLEHAAADGTPYPAETCPLCRAARSGTPHIAEHEVFRRKDGQGMPVEYAMAPMFDEAGAFEGSVLNFRDISGRKRAEQDRARLARLVEESSDYIGIADPAHRILYLNRAGRALVGFDEHESVGEIAGLVHESDRDRFVTEILPQVDAKGWWKGDLNLRHTVTGEAIAVSRTVFSMTDPVTGRTNGYGTITRDVRDRLAVERALQRSNTELQRRMAELEQFAYVASHDLQEPLRTVTSFSQLLVNRYGHEFDERGHLYARLITEATTRLGDLLQDLQTYTRVTSGLGEAGPVNTQRVLAEVLQTLGAQVQHTGAQVVTGVLPTVLGHPSQFRQLFLNLIGNALKFTVAGWAPLVQVEAVQEDDMWRFSVSDNGLGIAPEFHERIFTIFQRLHGRDKYEGNGIGLALARKIVERHGGRLWLDSTPGEGSTFFFTWPVHEERA
ncbi:PAS domain S-box protein [Deinococcus hohokamensis]|uniref:histidine kinase n=1 Tax=Deinococcus hohokamensis TaxID=309883 RepID=A0ABV9I8V8_9DEIO